MKSMQMFGQFSMWDWHLNGENLLITANEGEHIYRYRVAWRDGKLTFLLKGDEMLFTSHTYNALNSIMKQITNKVKQHIAEEILRDEKSDTI